MFKFILVPRIFRITAKQFSVLGSGQAYVQNMVACWLHNEFLERLGNFAIHHSYAIKIN